MADAIPKSEPDLKRKDVERRKFATALSQRCKWSVQEFAEKLQYEDAGICGKTECGTAHISEAHLKRVFPNKGGSGIRVEANEYISEDECVSVWKLYLAMYNHPPPNKEYAKFFLRSWLAEREGKVKINWAKFAYDISRKQYASWEKDGRVEEALNSKWDELQGLLVSDTAGQGVPHWERRQIGATCDPLRFTAEQTTNVVNMLKIAEADGCGIGPKL